MSGATCPFVCSGGNCTGVCIPNNKTCNGNVPQTCDQSGNWQSGTPCATAALCNPSTATCSPPVCTAGNQRCSADGSAVETCNSDETMWVATQTCGAPAICVAIGTTASCLTPDAGL